MHGDISSFIGPMYSLGDYKWSPTFVSNSVKYLMYGRNFLFSQGAHNRSQMTQNIIWSTIYQKNEKRDGHWPVFSKDFLERWLNCILKVKYTLLPMKSWAVLCVCVCKCMYALVRLLVFWLQSRHKENLVQRCIHRSTLVCVCVCVWNAI